jgi:transcriptional regulator with XRE-family HTH domain
MQIVTNADVAAKVRGVAAERRITQAQIASLLGVSPMAMSRRMSGTTPFAPEELIAIARHLGVAVATFFGEHADPQRAVAAA